MKFWTKAKPSGNDSSASEKSPASGTPPATGNPPVTGGPAASAKSKAGKSPRNPYFFLVIAVLGSLAGLLIGGLWLQWGVVDQTAGEYRQKLETSRAQNAAALLKRALHRVDQEVTSLSGLALVVEAMSDPLKRRQLETVLAAWLPQAERVVLTPRGQAATDSMPPVPLSFAALDLIRRAESGEAQPMEAFLSDGRWFVQKAHPVKDPHSQQVLGSLLVIFNQKLLTDILADVPGQPAIAVLQQVGSQGHVIARRGEPGLSAQVLPTSVQGWSLRYEESAAAAGSGASVWPAMIGTAVLVLASVGLAFALLILGLRDEFMRLAAYLQQVLLGERPKIQASGMSLVQPLVTVLSQHAQSAAQRSERAVAAAKAEAEAPELSTPPIAAVEEFSTPIFQNQDVLDINLMEGDEDLLGLADLDDESPSSAGPSQSAPQAARVHVAPEIFRAYDVRGVVGDTLTEDTVYLIGKALGSEAAERGVSALCLGYDGRESSPVLAEALTRGILETGTDVIQVGRVPTPVLYFATHHLETGSGVMVTGSHNPPQYNGLKMMLRGETLASEAILALYRRIIEGRFVTGQGRLSQMDVRDAYLSTILNDVAVAAPLKVVVDAGNGVAGELGPRLLQELGCEVIPLYCEVDGRFPNHHPDPSRPENLRDLIERVKAEGADLGIAFDGDGDRLGVVTDQGKIIWPDRLLMLFAKDVVSRNPGADVIYDVKCSRRLTALISGYGGRPIMWKTGHSLIKAKMRETGALLAGEMSGHIFFKERWFGFDDGLYSAARLLEILGVDERSCHQVFAAFPEDLATPEINVEIAEDRKFNLVERLADEGEFEDGNLSRIDGVRVDYADGWGLCRASNTTPCLVLRFEAANPEALERIQRCFRRELTRLDASLSLPF